MSAKLIKKVKANQNKPTNFMITGLSGSGKTSSAGPIAGPKALYVDLEGGLASIGEKDLNVWDINSLPTPEMKFKHLEELIKFLRTKEAQEMFKYVVFDSFTEMGQMMKQFYEGQPEYADKKKTMDLYGVIKKDSYTIVKALRDLPHYTKFYIGLSVLDKDESGNYAYMLSYPGSFSKEVFGMMDVVLHTKEITEDGESKRVFITVTKGNIMAKDRSRKLADVEPADLGAIIKKINS